MLIKQRTLNEAVVEGLAFITFCMAIKSTGKEVLAFALITIALTLWIPFQRGPSNRATRAVALALPLAAAIRAIVHFLPNPSL